MRPPHGVYLDPRLLRDTRYTHQHFPVDETKSSKNQSHLDHFKTLLPSDGVVVRFAGALVVIGVVDFFEDV